MTASSGSAAATLTGIGPAPGMTRQPGARPDGRTTDRRSAGPSTKTRNGSRDPDGPDRPGGTRALAARAGSAAGSRRRTALFSHLLSFGFVVGLVLIDVVVEGAAGVGHEHVVERWRGCRPAGLAGLEAVRRVLGDDAAAVEDRDLATEPFGLRQVVGREDDRRVVRRPELLDEGLDVELRTGIEPRCRLVEQEEGRARQQRPRDRGPLLPCPAPLPAPPPDPP